MTPNTVSKMKTVRLYRPVGKKEMELIMDSGMTEFPPRLPSQPIFYPVLNQRYAEEIAFKWNTEESSSGFAGFVTSFEIPEDYFNTFEKHNVGGTHHNELWVPAEQMEEFNGKIMEGFLNGTPTRNNHLKPTPIAVECAKYGERHDGEILVFSRLDELWAEYPHLFSSEFVGFEVNDGWYDIISQFLLRLESHKKYVNVYKVQDERKTHLENLREELKKAQAVSTEETAMKEFFDSFAENIEKAEKSWKESMTLDFLKKMYNHLPKVERIKEKFAEMRIIMEDEDRDAGTPYKDDYIDGLIDMTQAAAVNFCEDCGCSSNSKQYMGGYNVVGFMMAPFVKNVCYNCFSNWKRLMRKSDDETAWYKKTYPGQYAMASSDESWYYTSGVVRKKEHVLKGTLKAKLHFAPTIDGEKPNKVTVEIGPGSKVNVIRTTPNNVFFSVQTSPGR